MKIKSSQDWTYKKMLLFIVTVVFVLVLPSTSLESVPPSSKKRAKFYDFSEQVIDGKIKKPTALYTDARQKVKFSRLLKLKRSFLPSLLSSAKEPVFRK